jgi:CDP-glucose 4,6-dehydratase
MVDQLKILQQTYQGKKVFVTGHTGFKGSWLLLLLELLGANIKGYALESKNKNDLFNLINGNQLGNSIIHDIRDKKYLIDTVVNFQPDIIFHLAAQPLVRVSYQIPDETFEVNVMGTNFLLEAIRLLEKKCHVIIITTDKVYQNLETNVSYSETDRLGGYDPYSASKACVELLVDSYRNSFFNPSSYSSHHKSIAVARAGNVIGGGDWSSDRLLPDIARSISQQLPVFIRNPASVRPWQHVLDPLIGYLLLGKFLEENPITFSQAYNFGPLPDDTLTVEAMVQIAIGYWGKGSYKIVSSEQQPYEAQLLHLNISKALHELNWFPKIASETAVKMTVDWFKMFYEHPSAIVDFTRNQITSLFD